ncbi:MAG: dipicolinate synthase [Oscillospiraceae bacterium]|jgi:dipicolinate synthase subunit A|nr:dipicolinate synthase [Oscillospiraceae bacterium]
MNNFLFLGGDMRSVYAAKRLSEHYDCFLYGFTGELQAVPADIPVLREITKFKSLVLPLPSSRDGIHINAPFHKEQIPISIIPQAVEASGIVYCGKVFIEIKKICEQNNLELVDYFEREELIIKNAVPTSEGCIEIIMREQGSTIFGSQVLLTGFGRVSKVVAKHLTALGAEVTVTARKYSDLAWAEIEGCRTVHLSKLDDMLGKFDIVVNSVPAPLFSLERVKKLKAGCLLVDLASKCCVEDIEAAEKEGVNVIHALSLPGKVAPQTAGYIVADTIMNILEESANA